MRPARLLALVLLAVTALAGCSNSSSGQANQSGGGVSGTGSTIVVGASGSAESSVAAQLYAQALASAGFTVNTRLDLGPRATYLADLRAGSVDVVPDYVGALLTFYQPSSTETSPGAVYQALVNYLPGDLSAMDRSSAAATDTVVVTKATAAKLGLTSIADLASHAGQMTLAGPVGLAGSGQGPTALAVDYRVHFSSYDAFETSTKLVGALLSGSADAAILPASDPALLSGDLVALGDPEHAFMAQNLVPIVRGVMASPRLRSVLNPVSAALSTAALARMEQQVAGGADPASVARAWLTAQGLA